MFKQLRLQCQWLSSPADRDKCHTGGIAVAYDVETEVWYPGHL